VRSPALRLRCYLKMKFAWWTLPSFNFITTCLQPVHVLLVSQSYS
jgi:hypothetical protein